MDDWHGNIEWQAPEWDDQRSRIYSLDKESEHNKNGRETVMLYIS